MKLHTLLSAVDGFDVRQRDVELGRGERSCESRVGVAVDEDAIRLEVDERCFDFPATVILIAHPPLVADSLNVQHPRHIQVIYTISPQSNNPAGEVVGEQHGLVITTLKHSSIV